LLAELARPGARLIIQWAVEAFDAWLSRGLYERRRGAVGEA
jgi:hypothetical protein